MDKKIVERIRALLALASNNPSEAEAASAAARAAKMMKDYDLEQAEIEASGGEVDDEEIVQEIVNPNETKSNRDTWKGVIFWGVSKLFGVENFSQNGKYIFFGRVSRVQTATYTYRYLINEVDAQAQRYWRLLFDQSAGKRSVTNDFRRGAAGRLQRRMIEMKEAQEQQAQASKGALIVLAKQDARTEAAWDRFQKDRNFKSKGESVGHRVSAATRAGSEAGEKIHIHGDGTDARTLRAEPLRLASA